MHSKRQTLIISLITLGVFIALIVNFISNWFYSTAYKTEVIIEGATEISYAILNGQEIDFTAGDVGELINGDNTAIKRYIRFNAGTFQSAFYIRVKAKFKVDGMQSELITLNVDEDSYTDGVYRRILPGSSANSNWFYCDRLITPEDSIYNFRVIFSLNYEIAESLREEYKNKRFNITLTAEILEEGAGVDAWSTDLPEDFIITTEE